MISQFKEFLSYEQLHNLRFSSIPNKKGLYIVTKPKNINVVFTCDDTAIIRRGVATFIGLSD